LVEPDSRAFFASINLQRSAKRAVDLLQPATDAAGALHEAIGISTLKFRVSVLGFQSLFDILNPRIANSFELALVKPNAITLVAFVELDFSDVHSLKFRSVSWAFHR
jgi:hypothetical protein